MRLFAISRMFSLAEFNILQVMNEQPAELSIPVDRNELSFQNMLTVHVLFIVVG